MDIQALIKSGRSCRIEERTCATNHIAPTKKVDHSINCGQEISAS